MPSFPKHPCAHPGCAALVPKGQRYCDAHKAQHPGVPRSSAQRGYNSAWQKARQEYLNGHPLCAECAKRGVFTKATVVDHIRPHRGDFTLFWDRDMTENKDGRNAECTERF